MFASFFFFNVGSPKPTPPNNIVMKIIKKVWENKHLMPIIKAFPWRIIRRAIPTGAKASRYFKHISNICCRCGLQENDIHLFFTSTFARATWFHSPLHLRTDIIAANSNTITTIISNLLAINHPTNTIQHIFTFLWCLWKMRNEKLFSNEEGLPNQVIIRTHVLLNSLQINTSIDPPNKPIALPQELTYAGPKVFLDDAAWRPQTNRRTTKVGIGIYMSWEANSQVIDVFIAAKTTNIASPLQAKAAALITSAQIASYILLQDPSYFTDNLSLAKAAAGPSPTSWSKDHPYQ
jgi:hypothetical protein